MKSSAKLVEKSSLLSNSECATKTCIEMVDTQTNLPSDEATCPSASRTEKIEGR